jgi:hypothetical protein
MIYRIQSKQLLDNYAVLQTLQPNELVVGASITVAEVGAPYDGTFTILALPQYEFVGVDGSNGFLEYDLQNPIANQVLYACTGTDQNRTQQFTGTIDDSSVCTWITANDIATWLYLTPATPADEDFLISCAASANATCYRKRQEAGYADQLDVVPSADVELGTIMYGGNLYRARSSMDQIASFDGMGMTPSVGITSQIKILLGIPRPQVA